MLQGCENKIIIISSQPRVCVINHSNTLPKWLANAQFNI